MSFILKTNDEVGLMRKANQLVGATLFELGKHIRPGISTFQLEQLARDFILKHGGTPFFINFLNPLGGSFSVSEYYSGHDLNKKTVTLSEGDIISIDCGVSFCGFCGTCSRIFFVGNVSTGLTELVHGIEVALIDAINSTIPGKYICDIGYSIEQVFESLKGVRVRQIFGNSIGQEFAESTRLSFNSKRGKRVLLKNGMCFTINCIVSLEKGYLTQHNISSGFAGNNAQLSLHFKHTFSVGIDHVDILSSFDSIERIDS